MLADLVECLAAIGRSTQDEFDPRRFPEEFSAKVERLIPDDRLVSACLDDDRTFSVFAEHAKTGPVLHAEHYTTDFSPEGRYPMGDGALAERRRAGPDRLGGRPHHRRPARHRATASGRSRRAAALEQRMVPTRSTGRAATSRRPSGSSGSPGPSSIPACSASASNNQKPEM